MSVQNHAKVSAKNPALVLFVVDVSKSMQDSRNLSHVWATIPPLKNQAISKPNMIRFAVVGFDSQTTLLFNDPMEEARTVFDIPQNVDQRTNLKRAAETAKEVYEEHVSNYCTDKNPLASILFFTDGGHSPGIDYSEVPYGLEPNRWSSISVNDYLDYGENVICGLIDYEHTNGNIDFPDRLYSGKNKLTQLTRLSNKTLEKAYARDETHPPANGQKLQDIFGDYDNLVGKLFVIQAGTVDESPSSTAAFVRLGTYSSMVKANTDESEDDEDDNEGHRTQIDKL